jgi:inhibitor of KinA sporulation pathway (predicted exonuclease)
MGARKLLIVDLEATCWDRPEHASERMETIEIGALCIDVESSAAPREFQTFVRPVREPRLSEYCTRLTSIRQDDVDAAQPFAVEFGKFLQWIGDPTSVRFASWGGYDRQQLLRDCAHHRVAFPFGEDHLNLKHHCSAKLGSRPAGMAQALSKAGIELSGTHHRALDDARNIWRLVQRTSGSELAALVR